MVWARVIFGAFMKAHSCSIHHHSNNSIAGRTRTQAGQLYDEVCTMTRAFRPNVSTVVVLLGAACLSACSTPATSRAATPAPMAIEARPSSIVVENRVGRGLIAVRIAMESSESTAPFVLVVPSIDVGAKAEVELTKFMNDDAVMLDPAAVHIKQVSITAHDTLGQPHEITAPWTP
jgi:hypothetical protein